MIFTKKANNQQMTSFKMLFHSEACWQGFDEASLPSAGNRPDNIWIICDVHIYFAVCYFYRHSLSTALFFFLTHLFSKLTDFYWSCCLNLLCVWFLYQLSNLFFTETHIFLDFDVVHRAPGLSLKKRFSSFFSYLLKVRRGDWHCVKYLC